MILKMQTPEGGVSTPRKVGWDCATPHPIYDQNLLFLLPLITWSKIRYPIYDRSDWYS